MTRSTFGTTRPKKWKMYIVALNYLLLADRAQLSKRCIKWVSDIRQDMDNSTGIDELCQRFVTNFLVILDLTRPSVTDNMIQLGYQTPVRIEYLIQEALEEWSTLHVGNVFPIIFSTFHSIHFVLSLLTKIEWETMVPLIIKKSVTWNSDRNATNSKAQQIFNAVMKYKRETPASKWQCYPMHHCPPLANYSWVLYNPTNSFSWPPFRDLMYREQFQSTEAFDLAVECVEAWNRTVQRELSALCTNPELAVAVFTLSSMSKPSSSLELTQDCSGTKTACVHRVVRSSVDRIVAHWFQKMQRAIGKSRGEGELQQSPLWCPLDWIHRRFWRPSLIKSPMTSGLSASIVHRAIDQVAKLAIGETLWVSNTSRFISLATEHDLGASFHYGQARDTFNTLLGNGNSGIGSFYQGARVLETCPSVELQSLYGSYPHLCVSSYTSSAYLGNVGPELFYTV